MRAVQDFGQGAIKAASGLANQVGLTKDTNAPIANQREKQMQSEAIVRSGANNINALPTVVGNNAINVAKYAPEIVSAIATGKLSKAGLDKLPKLNNNNPIGKGLNMLGTGLGAGVQGVAPFAGMLAPGAIPGVDKVLDGYKNLINTGANKLAVSNIPFLSSKPDAKTLKTMSSEEREAYKTGDVSKLKGSLYESELKANRDVAYAKHLAHIGELVRAGKITQEEALRYVNDYRQIAGFTNFTTDVLADLTNFIPGAGAAKGAKTLT
jgi:hypothetical protein